MDTPQEPALGDRLPAIDRLRAERDRLAQEMYALRMQILRGNAALAKSQQAGGKTGPPDAAQVQRLRAEIAELEDRLRTLAATEQVARATIAKVDNGARRIAFLQAALEGLESSLGPLQTQLAQAEAARPPQRTLSDSLRASIMTLQAQIADARASLEAAKEQQTELEQAAAAARRELQDLARQAADTRASIDDKQAEI